MEEVVVHRERSTEVGDRLAHEARLVLRLGEVLQGAGVPRLQRGRTLELDDRGGLLTGVQQRRAQPEVDLEAARPEGVRAPEDFERVGESPLPHELGAELELTHRRLARHARSIAASPRTGDLGARSVRGMRVAFATCSLVPDGWDDDREATSLLGADFRSWDDADVDRGAYDRVVLRSVFTYQHHVDEFPRRLLSSRTSRRAHGTRVASLPRHTTRPSS